jgi:hypothetical protein
LSKGEEVDYHQTISRIAGLTTDDRREVAAGVLRDCIGRALDSNAELLDRIRCATVDETDPGLLATVYTKLVETEMQLGKISQALGINPCKPQPVAA